LDIGGKTKKEWITSKQKRMKKWYSRYFDSFHYLHNIWFPCFKSTFQTSSDSFLFRSSVLPRTLHAINITCHYCVSFRSCVFYSSLPNMTFFIFVSF
jgi:hypothetical protein